MAKVKYYAYAKENSSIGTFSLSQMTKRNLFQLWHGEKRSDEFQLIPSMPYPYRTARSRLTF